MCLAIPALIKSISGKNADVEIEGISRQASLWLVPEAKVGDYVLLHAGYAINIIDREEAEETLKLFKDIAASTENEIR